jgi:hypothetical protein
MPADTNTIKALKEYFGMSASEFMKDWKLMSEKDKADLKTAITNGSLTY